MRYFLRKYKEKVNNFKPVQLCFENDDQQQQLESIPELNNETSFEMVVDSSSSSSLTTTTTTTIASKISPNCILTRSRYKQQSKLSPMITITNMSKKLLTNTTNSPTVFQLRQTKRQQQQHHQQQQQQQQDDLIKLQQNLFSKFNDTESDDDDNNKKNHKKQQSTVAGAAIVPSSKQTKFKSSLSCSSTSSSDSDNDSDNINKTVKLNRGTTPPHKRFRKLRLFDTPQTPKTLIKKSTTTTTTITNHEKTPRRLLNFDSKQNLETKSIIPPTPQPQPQPAPKLNLEKSPCSFLNKNKDDPDIKMLLRVRLFDEIDNNNNTNILLESSTTTKIRSPIPYQPQANINPFTPNHTLDNSIIIHKTHHHQHQQHNDSQFNENNFSNQQQNEHLVLSTSSSSSSSSFINPILSIASSTSASTTSASMTTISSIKRHRNDTLRNDYDNNNNNNNDNDEHCDIDDIPKNKRLALRQCLVSRYHEEFHEVCKLGSGEFGDVFKCINRLDGCTYAIKRSKKPIAGSALEISAWKEVCAHAVLVKHNHIVQYYSAWAEADRMLIQNEYCNGGSLAEYIETTRLNGNFLMSEVDLKTLLLHTAKGLSYMHSLNLVHLDIKPGNIFICRHPRIPTSMIINEESGIESEIENEENLSEIITYKIGDLGHVTSTLDPRVEEGDCRYLPNEILQEEYDYLPKADIFALALTIFVCGSNEDLPKNGEEWHWIREGNLKDMPQCSEKFKKLLIQMINVKPLLRPSATTLIHHPCICPDASKNKAQLLKELNQEKFKNELLQRKVREYEQQIKVASPIKKPISNKFTRSLSCNLLS